MLILARLNTLVAIFLCMASLLADAQTIFPRAGGGALSTWSMSITTLTFHSRRKDVSGTHLSNFMSLLEGFPYWVRRYKKGSKYI
jgi:hypothetical protein